MAKDLFDSLYSKSGELIHSFTKHATKEAVAKPGDLPKPDAKKSAAASRAEKGKGSLQKPKKQKDELPDGKGTKTAAKAGNLPATAQLTVYKESLKRKYEDILKENDDVTKALEAIAESTKLMPKVIVQVLEVFGIKVDVSKVPAPKEDEIKTLAELADDEEIDTEPEVTPSEEEEAEPAPDKEATVTPEKEYFGEQGDDKQFYLVRTMDTADNVTGLEIIDELGDKVTDSMSLGIEDLADVGAFIIAASKEVEADMLSYDLFMKYVYPMIDKDEEVDMEEEEDEIEDMDIVPEEDEEEPVEGKKQRTTKKTIKCTKGDKVTEYRLKKVEVLEGKIPKDVTNKSDKAEKELREDDVTIQGLLKKYDIDEGTVTEGRTVELNALQAHVANSLLKWAVEQPKVKNQSTKKGSLVNWVNLTKPLIQKLDQEVERGASAIALDAMEAGVTQALVGWALEQPKIKKEGSKPGALINIDGVGKSILDITKQPGEEEVEVDAGGPIAPEEVKPEVTEE